MNKVLCLAVLLTVSVAKAQRAPVASHPSDASPVRDTSSRMAAAEAALEKGDFVAAVAVLKALTSEQPKNAQIAYDLGYAEERSGDETAAAEAYARTATLAPQMAEPKVALGLLDARAGRAEKAHEELQAAAAIPTTSPELRGRALRALAALDEPEHADAARDELIQAVRLTSETPEDVAMSARLAVQAGDTTDAEAAYRKVLSADPNDASATTSLAALLVKAGKDAEAESILEAGLRAHPNDRALLSQLAAVYGKSGKTQEAIDLLEKARANDQAFAANPAAIRMLARLESLAGNDAEAANLYAGLVGKTTSDPLLLDEYGGALVKTARFAEAQAVFSKAVTMRPVFPTAEDWAEAESHLAFAASRNHEPVLALQSLALRATVLPNSPSSLFLQAISYDALHRNGEAVKAYRAFLAAAQGKYPDQEFQAKHRLVALEHMK